MILISDLSSHEQIYIKDVYFDIDKHLHSPMSHKKLHIKLVKIDLLVRGSYDILLPNSKSSAGISGLRIRR